MSNQRNNKLAAIPEVGNDLQSVATAVRALKQTVDVLARQSGTSDNWYVTMDELQSTVTSVVSTAKSGNTDWSKLLNDPTIDKIFDRAAAEADRLAQNVRDEARIALAKFQTAFDNFRNGYVDDNAVVKAAISKLEASVEESDAKISSEQLARVTATQSLAGRIDTVSAQTKGNIAAVTTDIVTLTDANSALAARIDTVTTASTNAKTYVQSTQPLPLTTNAYWVDISGSTPVVKQWTGSAFTTLTATIASTAPATPATNSLWFDTTTTLLKRWSGTAWVNTGAFVQAKTPTTLTVGDYWLDTATANTLKRWDGTAWVAVDKNDNVFGILLSSVISESLSRTDNDRTTATKIDNLISIAPDGNSATINNTAITTATRTSALASDLTDLKVQTTGGQAGGFYRLIASANPTDGAIAEFNVQVRAAESGANSTFTTAGMRIQAMSNGTSRVKFNTDQFVIANSTNTYTPFAVTNGQLVMQAFTAASNVTGLGSLATKNSVSASTEVTGLGTLATKNSVSAATEVTGLGTLATKNSVSALTEVSNLNALATLAGKITSSNAATYIENGAIVNALIANAAIANANIGTAAVDTLKIAGNAVTVPVRYSFGSVGGNGGSFTGYFTLPDSANVLVSISVTLPNDGALYANNTQTGFTSADQATTYYPQSVSSAIQIAIEGVQVYSEVPPHMMGNVITIAASRLVSGSGTKSFSISFTPSGVPGGGGYPNTGACPRNIIAYVLAAAR